MSLPESIKLIRQKALLSQEELAKELHVSLAFENRWEVGKSVPNITAMKSIKAFCEKNGFSYAMIEEQWLPERTTQRNYSKR